MSLYSVMLVDDEEEVREAIARKLDWESMGFKVVGTAENGEEALEIAEQLRPDVVMTDIKMPFMDGLTFCRRLKENQMNTKVVIFSGFDEFDYAKEAIKLEVEEYILKPINAAELREVFERLKETLDREIAEKRNMDYFYRYYQESLPIMKDQFLTGLIQGRIPPDRIEELSNSYQLPLKAPFYSVAEIHMDHTNNNRSHGHDPETWKRMLAVSGKQILDEQVADMFQFHSFLHLDCIVVIGMLQDSSGIRRMIHYLDQFCKICKRVLSVNTTAGIGQICDSLVQLPFSYGGAVDAVEARVLIEPDQAIYIKDIEPNSKAAFMLEDQAVQNIMRAVKLGTEEELKNEVQSMIQHMKKSMLNVNQYQITLMEIVTETLKVIGAYGVETVQVFGTGFDLYRDPAQFETLEMLEHWLLDTMLRLRSFIRRERKDTAKLLVEKAIQYIGEHYGKSELSVDMLCNHLNVSPAYFSALFKKETGMTFVAYLTRIRLERAIYLLEATDQKTYMIAESVGYTEPNYFSYVFKKKYGISPSRYRLQKMGD